MGVLVALGRLKSGLWWVGGLWSWVGLVGWAGGWAEGRQVGWLGGGGLMGLSGLGLELALTWVGRWAGGLAGGDGLVYWCPWGWDEEH